MAASMTAKQNHPRQKARYLQARPIIANETPPTETEPSRSAPTERAQVSAPIDPSDNSADSLDNSTPENTWLYMVLGSWVLLIGVSVVIVLVVKKKYMSSKGMKTAPADKSAGAASSIGGSHPASTSSATSSGYIDISNGSNINSSITDQRQSW